jgi:hypothetical protein
MTDVDRGSIADTLADRVAINELETAYCRHFDEHDGDGWSRLFTEDGRYRSRGAGPGGDPSRGVYAEGREALAAFCTNAPFTGIHLLHPPKLDVRGETAIGRLHFEHVGAFDGREGLSRSVGFYDVRYERVAGEWLFADKVTTVFCMDGALLEGYPSSAFDSEG